MKNLLALLLLIFAVAGCATGPSKEEIARQERIKEEQRVAQEKRKADLQAKWSGLRAGMTLTEVESTIGKLPASFTGLMNEFLARGAGLSLKSTVEDGMSGGIRTQTGNPQDSTYTHNDPLFVVVFDYQGKLKTFQRR